MGPNGRQKLVAAATVLLVAPLAAAAECRPPSEPHAVTAFLSLDGSARRVRVDYRFAQVIDCLVLADAPGVRARAWRLEGAALDGDGRTLRLAAPARSLTVWLDDAIADGAMDRVYTPLLPFADGRAAAVYSESLLPAPAFGQVTFRFEGVVAAGGMDAGPDIALKVSSARASGAYLVVGRPQVLAVGRDRFIVDRALPPGLLAEIRGTLKRVEVDLAPLRNAGAATSFLVTRSGRREGPRSWRGDTLEGAVRLNFIGDGWDRADAASSLQLRRFVIHELFHLVNAVVRGGRPGDGAISLLEGSAEAAAWDLLRRHGEIDAAAFGDAFEDAASRCSGVAGDTLAAKEQANLRVAPYACGQALAQLLAAAGRIDGESDPLAAWGTIMKGARRNTVGWTDLLAAHQTPSGRRAAAGAATPASPPTGREPQAAVWSVLEALAGSHVGWDPALAQLVDLGLLRTAPRQQAAGEPQRPRYRLVP